MTLRKLLVIPILLSVALLVIFSDAIARSFTMLRENVRFDAVFFAVVLCAVGLQLAGHIIRAYKMRYLLSPVKQGTTRFQFRALSIGYACNVLLPFKLGELIRAKVIAGGEKISFGFAFILVIVERAFDALILVVVGVVFYFFHFVGLKALSYLLVLVIFVAMVTAFVGLAGRQNRQLLRVWHALTTVFNKPIQNSLRFKAWSIIYGLQRTFSIRRLVIYSGLTIASWGLYILSCVMLMRYLLPGVAGLDTFIRAVAPYLGMSVPAGPASLGAFSEVTNAFAAHVALPEHQAVLINLLSWGLLVLPISITGLVLLFLKTPEPVRRHLPEGHSTDALADKLARSENITPEMGSFLESYFSGNTLSHIVHRLELQKDFRLLQYFKGGSDAITLLALQNKKKVVKKIIPIDLAPRLKAQYDWLKRRKGKYGIVEPLSEQATDDHYSIDLAYDPDNEMYFDYVHHTTFEESKKVMDTVWEQLHKSIYGLLKSNVDYEAVEEYMEKHVYGCMAKACSANQELLDASQPSKIKINGTVYDNFEAVLARIKKNKRAMRDLATFSRSDEVHGDVAIDNILVSKTTHRPLLIDPAPDGNIIVGPVFDFGKNMQSLYCGYEFIVRSEDVVQLQPDGSIEYYDRLSVPYRQLCEYVQNDLSTKYLTEGERRAMIFHAGALLIRRLKHQVYQAPGLTLAIYGAGIRALNDFISLYEK